MSRTGWDSIAFTNIALAWVPDIPMFCCASHAQIQDIVSYVVAEYPDFPDFSRNFPDFDYFWVSHDYGDCLGISQCHT